MESTKGLNDRILSTRTLIHSDYPELISFLDELPAPFPQSEEHEICREDLKDYLESLNELMRRYSKDH